MLCVLNYHIVALIVDPVVNTRTSVHIVLFFVNYLIAAGLRVYGFMGLGFRGLGVRVHRL